MISVSIPGVVGNAVSVSTSLRSRNGFGACLEVSSSFKVEACREFDIATAIQPVFLETEHVAHRFVVDCLSGTYSVN